MLRRMLGCLCRRNLKWSILFDCENIDCNWSARKPIYDLFERAEKNVLSFNEMSKLLASRFCNLGVETWFQNLIKFVSYWNEYH